MTVVVVVEAGETQRRRQWVGVCGVGKALHGGGGMW